MTRPWQPDLKRALGCQFFYEVPEPACDCRTRQVEDGSRDLCDGALTCDLCDGWEPTVACRQPAHVRVQLEDGRYVDCCDERAHGYARVAWWAPLYSQPSPQGWGPVMKYFYREQAIGELAAREHPFFQLVATSGGGPGRWP